MEESVIIGINERKGTDSVLKEKDGGLIVAISASFPYSF